MAHLIVFLTVCGLERIPNPTGLIVGGYEAKPYQYRLMVRLVFPFPDGSIGLCTGSIINDRMLLTAYGLAWLNTVNQPTIL